MFWFKKSLFSLMAVLLLVGGITLNAGAQTPAQQPAQVPEDAQEEIDPAENRAGYINFITGSLQSGEMDKWRGTQPRKTAEDIVEYLGVFNMWAFACEDGPKFELNAQESKIFNDFKTKAKAVQTEALPKLRDAFGPVLRSQISEYDMTARTVGQGYKTVEFIGPMFADKAAVQEFHEMVKMSLVWLRFEKANYKATKDGKVESSVPVITLNDGDMVIWLEGSSNYRMVK